MSLEIVNRVEREERHLTSARLLAAAHCTLLPTESSQPHSHPPPPPCTHTEAVQVGFYQIAKLCVIPFVCVVEYLVYSRHFSHAVVLSIALVVSGVAVVTVSDVAVNWAGLNVAVLSIVSAGSQQLLCRHFQTTLKISSNEMLLFTAWPMAALLLGVGPTLDWVITGGFWVFEYEYTKPAVIVVFSSCALAVGVNLSQFACLGRFSAVAYQVRHPVSVSARPCLFLCPRAVGW